MILFLSLHKPKAQFRPHTDNGAGAGQSNSLIVGLGNYSGGELMVEGVKKDIRYNPTEFDGWKERHWTLPCKFHLPYISYF
jgi:hypothetical protein